MKLTRILMGLLVGISLSGCLKDTCETTYTYVRYDPLYILPAALRQEVNLTPARTLEEAGKIYVYNKYLLINEVGEGIHVYDNSNPAAPLQLGFLPIPGNRDLAVRNGYLYADSYVDLVVIDLHDPQAPRQVQRLENVFPGFGIDAVRGLLVEYVPSQVSEQFPCNEDRGIVFWDGPVFWVRAEVGGVATPSNDVGIGGSTARFTMAAGHLYTVNHSDLSVFGLGDDGSAKLANRVAVGWDIETIYPFLNNLFIGSMNGMYIYNIDEPTAPRQMSVFEHVRACDPVVTDGRFAYVTLRDGTECQGFNNQLDVVDVANLEKPSLVKTYPMHHPIGLSIVDGLLFICEDDQGLKIFDATDVKAIDQHLLNHDRRFQATDVIVLPDPKLAIVTGTDGIYQLDYTDPTNLKILSSFKPTKP